MNKCCPFCLSLDLEYDSFLEAVICNGCGGAGPTAPTEEEAYALWDDRECECDEDIQITTQIMVKSSKNR